MKRLCGGIYLFRTNKPYSILGLPLIGRHNGYTGQSNAYALRWQQHTAGGGKFKSTAKSWSDLDPEPWRILPLPAWLFAHAPRVVNALEAVCIVLTAPVYNVQLNKWNPRRITPVRAKAQRQWRSSTFGVLRISFMLLHSLPKFLLLVGAFLLLRKGLQ